MLPYLRPYYFVQFAEFELVKWIQPSPVFKTQTVTLSKSLPSLEMILETSSGVESTTEKINSNSGSHDTPRFDDSGVVAESGDSIESKELLI